MKLRLALLLLAATLLTSGASALAQDTSDAAQNLETLRAQLNEVPRVVSCFVFLCAFAALRA